MPARKITYSIILLLAVLALVPAGIIQSAGSKEIKVVFLNVGQGDAILIEQGDKQILIDGGPDGQVELEELGKYVPFWDRNIEAVIATHPDADHITGLIDVMKNYTVDEVIDTGVGSSSQVYASFEKIIQDKKIAELEAKAGMKIKLDGGEMDILYPNGAEDKNNPKDTNLSSVVARLTFGQNSFLFTGDLPIDGEMALMASGQNISAAVLKVGHHGSKYSSSEAFLEKVNPVDAVASVGVKNRYGHPAPEVIDRLSADKFKIYRTDQQGDIVYDCAAPDQTCRTETELQ
jgi:competence protein ComEC